MADQDSPLRTSRGAPTLFDQVQVASQLSSEDRYNLTNPNEGEFKKGLRTGAAGLSASSFANQALSQERAGDPQWEASRDSAFDVLEGAAPYAARVSSLRDVGSLADAGDYAANTIGQGVMSMAPVLATALVTRGRGKIGTGAAYAGGALTAYGQEKGEAALGQYGDETLAATDVVDRDNAATAKGVVNAALESVVPGGLATSVLRRPFTSALKEVGKDTVKEGVTETAQTITGMAADQYLDPGREVDGMELLDAFAGGALTGGAVSGATRLPTAAASSLASAITPKEGTGGDPTPAATPAPTMTERANGTPYEAFIKAGWTDEQLVKHGYMAPNTPEPTPTEPSEPPGFADSIIQRMGEASMSATGPADFLRKAFNDNAESEAEPLIVGDNDPTLAGATPEETEANLLRADQLRAERAAAFAQRLIDDPKTPDPVKQKIAEMGGAYADSANQQFLGRTFLKQQAETKIESTVNDVIALGSKLAGAVKGKFTKQNMQDTTPTEQAVFNKLVFDQLTDEAKASPEVRKRLPELANTMLAFAARTGELDDGDISTLTDIYSSFSLFQDVDALSEQLTTYASLPRPGDSFLARAKRVNTAQRDIVKPNSFLYSALTSEAKDTLTSSGLKQLAKLIDNFAAIDADDDHGSHALSDEGKSAMETRVSAWLAKQLEGTADEATKTALKARVEARLARNLKAAPGDRGSEVLAGLATAFGSEDNARAVLDYYASQNRAGLGTKVDTKAEGMTQQDAQELTGSYRDPNPNRPFLRGRDDELAKTQLKDTGGTNSRIGTLAEYTKLKGESMSARAKGVRADLVKRIEDEARRDTASVKQKIAIMEMQESLTRDQRNELLRLKALKTESRPNLKLLRDELKAQDEAATLAKKEGRNASEARLSLYDTVLREETDTMASDENVAKFRRLLDQMPDPTIGTEDERAEKKQRVADIKATAIGFKRKGQSLPMYLSAESMVHSAKNKGTVAQRFADAVASVLARGDIEGLAGEISPDTIIKRGKNGSQHVLYSDIAPTQSRAKSEGDKPRSVARKKKGPMDDVDQADKEELEYLENQLERDYPLPDYEDFAQNHAAEENEAGRYAEEGAVAVAYEERKLEVLIERRNAASVAIHPKIAEKVERQIAASRTRLNELINQYEARYFEDDTGLPVGVEKRGAKPEKAAAPAKPEKLAGRPDRGAREFERLKSLSAKELQQYITSLNAQYAKTEKAGTEPFISEEGGDDSYMFATESLNSTLRLIEDQISMAEEALWAKPEKAAAPAKNAERVILPKNSPYAAKDQAKSDRATKFIGRGAPGSSTAAYAEAWGDRANTGVYASDDVVFISVNGNRPGALTPPWAEIKKAMSAGATLITDVAADRARNFNTGERAVADFLDTNGYFEKSPGTWVHGYVINNATGAKSYAPLGKQSSQNRQTTVGDEREQKERVSKQNRQDAPTGLDFNNKRVQENLSAAGISEWQDPELTGWGARNRHQAYHDAYKKYLTPEDTIAAARAQRMATDQFLNSEGQAYINKVMDSRVPGGDFHAYIDEQMKGMPTVMERAWAENDGDGRLKAEWDKLKPAEKFAANARRVAKEKSDAAFKARMDLAGIPAEFRVRNSSDIRLETPYKYRDDHQYSADEANGKFVLTYTPIIEPFYNDEREAYEPDEADALDAEMAAKEEQFYKDNPPQELGTFDSIEAAEVAASKHLMGEGSRIVKNTFVGAKTDPEGAAAAERMLGTADTIWHLLGWFRGPDGKLRKEVQSPVLKSRLRVIARHGATTHNIQLSQLLHGIAEFAGLAPLLKGYTLEVSNDVPSDDDIQSLNMGAFAPADKQITVNLASITASVVYRNMNHEAFMKSLVNGNSVPEPSDLDAITKYVAQLEGVDKTAEELRAEVIDEIVATMLHEFQHAVQHVEGFEGGGTPVAAVVAKFGDPSATIENLTQEMVDSAFEAMRAHYGPDADLEDIANRLYHDIIGEVEAFDVERRMKLSPEEARQLRPALDSGGQRFIRSIIAAGASMKLSSTMDPLDDGPDGVSVMDRETKDKIKAEILRIRGPEIKVLFGQFAQIGASGEFSMDGDKTNRLIKIAMNAINPTSVAWHESLHDFMAMLGGSKEERQLKRDLLDAAQAPQVMTKLRELLKGHPKAITQIENDKEERLAYMYQFWAEGKLSLGPTGTNIFTRIAKFLREALGVLSQDEKITKLLDALHTGKFANQNLVSAVLEDLKAETIGDKVAKVAGPIYEGSSKLFTAATDRLRDTNVDALGELADLFHREPGHEAGGLPFLQSRSQQVGKYLNKLQGVLDKTTATERRAALENMLSMKAPSSKLERDVAALLEDIRVYMDKAGVKRFDEANKEWVPMGVIKNYFPRNWDKNVIRNRESDFITLLTQHVGAEQARATYSAIVNGDGAPELQENKHSLGFTPFMQAVQDRRLNFINENNAALFTPFMNKDMLDALTTYIQQAVHRGEYAKTFGNAGKVIQAKLGKAKEQGASNEDLAMATNAVMAMEGTLGHDFNPRLKELMSGIMTYQNIVLLPLALFSSLIDPLGVAMRSNDMKEAFHAFSTGLQSIAKDLAGAVTGNKKVDEREEMAKLLGIIDEQNMLEAMGHVYNSMHMSKFMKKVNSAFFRGNGMETWNRGMRVAATSAAQRFIVRNTGNDRYMKELGITKADVFEQKDGTIALTQEQLVAAGATPAEAAKIEKRIQAAVFKFVDGAVLRPNAAHRPIWGSDPRFQLIFHLKQFTYSFHNTILKRVGEEMRHGNAAPVLILLSYVPFMLASDIMKGSLMGTLQNGTDLYDVVSRSVARSGIMGLGTFGADAVGDAGHGSIPGSSFLGPTFDHLMTILDGIFGNTSLTSVVERSIPGGTALRGVI